MKAIDRPHFLAIEKLRKQIDKDKAGTGIKRVYLVELEERYEIKPLDVDSLGAYHDAYGVWFAGSLGSAIYRRCGFAHAFLSTKPEKCEEGVFDISTYGIPCKLYFWHAQGYNRGMIVAVDDAEELHQTAARLLAEKPWQFNPILETIREHISLTLGARIAAPVAQ